ncbi:relaxase/mobilization nuclease domain-containing protein [Ideonella sp. DXS29W]|uniref:Relaxase/mobilization nuclease domain-containing protein n=1 Tax=Ideonella lacteola TaxID=2984193 RepID=A0ABU9C0N8_9BURK
MSSSIDAELASWGDRMFFGMPKKGKKGAPDPRIMAGKVRTSLRVAVSPKASQVMVKITGGGKGLGAIGAHMRYISRQGKQEVGGPGKTLEVEDERGNILTGKDDIAALREDWRMAGTPIPDESHRREAFNIILSMPGGTPSDGVRDSAREFAAELFRGHRYAFVLHEDTDSPHVHLVVRAERSDGVRLNPKIADLRRWRRVFAERLQDRGINAIAMRAASRGQRRAPQPIWRLKTSSVIRKERGPERSQESIRRGRDEALAAWAQVQEILKRSQSPQDQQLANEVSKFVERTLLPGKVISAGGANVGDDARGPKRSR